MKKLIARTDPSVSSASPQRFTRHRALAASAATMLAAAMLWLPATASADSIFWKGTTDGTWTGANWASDAAGTATTAIPTAADDVTFSISSGATHQATALGQNFTIHSLSISDSLPVTIDSDAASGPFSLTLSGAAGTGINVQAGAGAVNIGGGRFISGSSGGPEGTHLSLVTTVMSNVTLAGASDTITVNNAGGLTITTPLAGSNGLAKKGFGTLTLAGPNTYTGGTTVNAGRLIVDNDGNSTFGTLGSGTTTVNGSPTPSNGVSSGGAHLDFYNLATAGNGTFNVKAGTASGRLGGSVTFYFGATAGSASLTANGGSDGGNGGIIQFSGTSTAGTASLTANGGTQGGTGIYGDGGTIYFTDDSRGGAANVTLNGNGKLDISNHAPFFGIGHQTPIVGIGSLSGDGIVFLGSNNLTVGSDNSQLATTFSGTLKDRGWGGETGGSLTKIGTGTLTLSGMNTYTGATTVNGGILKAGSTQAFGINSPVTVNEPGYLDLGGNNITIGSLSGDGFVATSRFAVLTTGGLNKDTTFSGVLSSSIGAMLTFVKVGTGTQVLGGNNSYVGDTVLKEGTLAAGSFHPFGYRDLIMTGGTLRTEGGPRIVQLGFPVPIDPNGPSGALSNPSYFHFTGGNILFTGGTYQAQVGGTTPGETHDQLKTSGTANISGANVALIQLGNYHLHAGDKVVLISADGGVSGGTAGGTPLPAEKVTGLAAFSANPLLTPVVNLYTTSVVLEAIQGSFMALSHTLAFTPGQTAVAGALDSLLAGSGGKTGASAAVDFLDALPTGAIGPALDMLSPAALTSLFNLSASLANVQTANIQSHLADIRAAAGDVVPVNSVNVSVGLATQNAKDAHRKVAALADEERWGFFMTGSGEFTHIGGLANGAGVSLDTGGVTAGVDYRFTDHFAAGVSLGYMNTNAGLPSGGNVDVHGGRIGAYATWFGGGLHFDAAVTGGFNNYYTRRTAPDGTASTASPEGSEVSVLFAGGYDWKWRGLTIGPTASVQYTHTQLDGFTERGTFAPLRVQGQDSESLRSALGIRASFEKKIGRRVIRPEVRAAWQHESGDVNHTLTSSFATLGGTPFTVSGPATGRDSLLLSAGFSVQWTPRFATYAYYDGELLRTNYSSNSVSIGFRYQF